MRSVSVLAESLGISPGTFIKYSKNTGVPIYFEFSDFDEGVMREIKRSELNGVKPQSKLITVSVPRVYFDSEREPQEDSSTLRRIKIPVQNLYLDAELRFLPSSYVCAFHLPTFDKILFQGRVYIVEDKNQKTVLERWSRRCAGKEMGSPLTKTLGDGRYFHSKKRKSDSDLYKKFVQGYLKKNFKNNTDEKNRNQIENSKVPTLMTCISTDEFKKIEKHLLMKR